MPVIPSRNNDDERSTRVDRAFRIAYDGTGYHGFQRQPSVLTVENEILHAFENLGIDALASGYAAAGRTDAGVSAAAQTIATPVPEWLTPAALTAELPDDIVAWAFADVDPAFHPRYDATLRVYEYYLVVDGFDIQRGREAADRMVGVHDFRDLSAARGDTKRELQFLGLEPQNSCITLTARAPGFLHQQVRRIATVILRVGTGEYPVEFVDRLMDPDEKITGGDGVPPAPPGPLVLRDVEYDGITFEIDEDVRDRGIISFGGRADEHRGLAASMNSIVTRLESSSAS